MIDLPAEPPQWGQCVLTVEQHLDRPERKALKFAMRKVGNRARIEFRFAKTDGQIVVSYDDTIEDRYWGWANTWAYEGGSIFLATIRLNPDLMVGADRRTRRSVLMHELAHTLGVPHNVTNRRSVMFPTVNGVVKWSKWDRAELRKAGC